MTEKTIEISVKGKWVRVPAVEIGGRTVTLTGKRLKIAAIHDAYWQESEVDDPELYIRSLKDLGSKGFKADIFTFGQKLPNVEPRFSYPLEWDNVAAIRISSFEEWLKKLSSDTRRNVKTAPKRGVVTKVQEFNEELVRGIVEINNESPIRQGRRFWHYGKDFEAVRKDYATFIDRSAYIGAYFQDELIAFMKIVYVGKVAAIMQNMSKISHHDKKAANALIAKAVELCEQLGLSYLTYFQYRYGNKRDSPLTEFKRRNGFEEVLLPRYYVPLTLKGSTARKLSLHRQLTDVIPEPVLSRLRKVRSFWYGRVHSKGR